MNFNGQAFQDEGKHTAETDGSCRAVALRMRRRNKKPVREGREETRRHSWNATGCQGLFLRAFAFFADKAFSIPAGASLPRGIFRWSLSRFRAAAPVPAPACSSRSLPASRARTACRSWAGCCRAGTGRPARNATNPGSAPRRSAPACPASSRPNSNLVSAMMMPRVSAYSAAALYSARLTSRTCSARSAPSSPAICVERDVLVVCADRGLGRRREDRFGQAVGLFQAGRQRDAAHRLAGLVFLPAASRPGSRARWLRPAAP